MKFAVLAADFERLEATSGRLEMTAILTGLLGKVPKGDLGRAIRLLQGTLAPDWEGLELGVAEKQILKALALATGEPAAALEAAYRSVGDLGLAAEQALAKGSGKRQATLFGHSDLTLAAVFREMLAIAHTTGTGSQEGKQRILAKLLLEASPLEARYIIRMAAGRLRLGVADMTMLDALAHWHLGVEVRSVQEMEADERAKLEDVRRRLERAFDLRSDLAAVATCLAEGGMEAIDAVEVELGVPVRPMAAERIKTLAEILETMGGRCSLEYKYDGLRIQAHVPKDKKEPVRLFSRRLEDVTAQFPDVAANLRAHTKLSGAIVEGEAMAVDEAGRLRPFQDIARRRGRKADLESVAAAIPVTLFLFDCIADHGRSVMHLGLAERRAHLTKAVPVDGPIRLSAQLEATTVEQMADFFDTAVQDGAEGIMCKDPAAPYKAGSRGFAWVKFKTDYTEELVDTMDLVCIGAFHGRGRRAGWYGALLMAARDEASGTFASVCKLGTGFKDEDLEALKPRFAALERTVRPPSVDSALEPDVWFEPELVAEVQAAELTLSPTHRAAWGHAKPDAGLAARFPRFMRWRDDKGPKQATTVKELLGLLEKRARRSSPGTKDPT